MDEPLMNLRPKGEFQKFIWEREMNKLMSKEIKAQKEINKELKKKNDELEVEMKEMAIKFKKNEVGQLILKNKRLRGEVWLKDAKIKSYKKDLYKYQQDIIRLQDRLPTSE